MPRIGFDVAHETRFQSERQLGSDLLMLGWVLLGMCAIAGIFVFQDIREGTHMWLAFEAIVGIVGLALVGVGTYLRRHVPE